MTTTRPSAVERYALEFDRERPDAEPTDANLKDALNGTTLPIPHRLLDPVRKAVIAYRATPERAQRLARDRAEAERTGVGAGEGPRGSGLRAGTVPAGSRTDAELRARVRPWKEGDEYRAGDRVMTQRGAGFTPGQSRGVVLGADPQTAHEQRNNYPQQFVIELDERLRHGRKVVSLPVTRITREACS